MILFDLDGTLADFDGSMSRYMRALATPEELANGTYYSQDEENEPEYLRERRRLVKRQPGFWRNLERLPLGFALFDIALDLGFRISILTKAPRTNFPAWSEKVEWCHANLPMERVFSVNLVEDKGLVYGRILVDDWPLYIKQWQQWRPRGLVLMPDQPWNRDFSAPNVLRVKETDLEAVRALMREKIVR